MEMRRAHHRVLVHLMENPDRFIVSERLPNGHGHIWPGRTSAKPATLHELEAAGYIRFGQDEPGRQYGYKITDEGKLAAVEWDWKR